MYRRASSSETTDASSLQSSSQRTRSSGDWSGRSSRSMKIGSSACFDPASSGSGANRRGNGGNASAFFFWRADGPATTDLAIWKPSSGGELYRVPPEPGGIISSKPQLFSQRLRGRRLYKWRSNAVRRLSWAGAVKGSGGGSRHIVQEARMSRFYSPSLTIAAVVLASALGAAPAQ